MEEIRMEDLPIGFAMNLATDLKAMGRYSSMSQAEREQLISQAHQLQTKEEMQQFVSRLGNGDTINSSFH